MADTPVADTGRHPEQLHEVYGVQLRLAQYPILAPKVRELMRRELFAKGIISVQAFEAEVRQKAIISQHREGLADPFGQESERVWNERLAIVRDQLTDFYFAYNFPPERLSLLIQRTLSEPTYASDPSLTLGFNPELAPLDLLFTQGQAYEALPAQQREQVRHHLREIIVVLIKGMLSDQLEFVGIAKEVFTVRDLREVRRRLIGHGKIGGKAAGLLLARKIMETPDPDDPVNLSDHVRIPDSYFIGADVFYDFQLMNGFTRYMNQKYRRAEEITTDYPKILESYAEGQFPDDIVYGLQRMLDEVGTVPLIVRSSSLLEVHFGAALAGKYESIFCPNQGTPEENLNALLRAVSRVYASTLSPDALLYRQHMGLVDYDERMAVLIQKVQGTRYRNYLFPAVAGVGYSRNPFRWNPKIRRDVGFLRLVTGFGTRAVERVGNDYPRIVALSHPELRPFIGSDKVRKYSQRYMDVLDLEDHRMKTVPVKRVIQHDFPGLRYLAALDRGDYIAPILARVPQSESNQLILTFDRLVQDQRFTTLMQAILNKLERYHQWPVDIEFTVDFGVSEPTPDLSTPKRADAPASHHSAAAAASDLGSSEIAPSGWEAPRLIVNLLQCRPQVSRKEQQTVHIPDNIPPSDIIIQTTQLVPRGVVSGISHIVYVKPESYRDAPTYAVRLEIARVIGRLNRKLAGTSFILIGPGRWGSSDVDLGVKVTYADIYNTKMLVEVSSVAIGTGSEPSYGTHFFQDLVEAGIYPLPVALGDKNAILNTHFLNTAPNLLPQLLPEDADYSAYIRVIDVPAVTQGRTLEVVMNDEQERAVGYLKDPSRKGSRV